MIASPSYPAQTPAQQEGEPVAHGLRSVYNAGNGGPCPYPKYWRVEVEEEDAKDANLMAVCAAIAGMDNRALSPAEIGDICVDAGWVRLSPAITPATLITTTIRTHQRRCQFATPPRDPLITKHQLQGSLAESHLGPALHPDAYTQGKRPRGAVWFLCPGDGRPWKDPFVGLEVLPPAKRERKKKDPAAVVAPRRSTGSVNAVKPRKPRPSEIIEALPSTSAPAPQGIKIRFKVAGGVPSASALREDADVCSAGPSTASGSGSGSRAESAARGSESDDSSDSDLDLITPNIATAVNRFRRAPPAPLALTRTSHPINFLDLFMNSPSTMPHSPDTASVPFSPFPSHSLDNTTWASHRPGDVDFESSSDSEAGDWGNQSGVLSEAMEVETAIDVDEDEPEAEVEAEVEQAMSPGETGPTGSLLANLDLNLQNQPEASTSTTPPRSTVPLDSPIALRRCRVTIPPHLSLPLAPWTPGSSPMPSPTCFDEARHESRSPTAHLSGLPVEGAPDDLVSSSMMDIDVDVSGVHDVWAGEIEMPVKLEDEDEEMDTTAFDESAWEAEAERQARAAAWARRCGFEAPVKRHEDDDAPSPVTELDLEDPEGTPRGSSSNTPSSRSSELPPSEADIENPLRPCDEILLGPESVGMDELDTVWGMPGTEARIEWDAKRKTPRIAKLRTQSASAAGGAWGGIGVGSPLVLQFKGKAPGAGSGATVTRSKSSRGIRPSRSAVAPPVVTIVAEPDEDEDGVGTADLERAGLWADEQEIKRQEVASSPLPSPRPGGGLSVDDACMSTTAISPPALVLSPGVGAIETTVPPAALALPTPAPSPTPEPAAISIPPPAQTITVPIIAPKPIAPAPASVSASAPAPTPIQPSISPVPDIIVHPNKPLWPPVHASILDDIPVYRSEWEGRSGTGRDGCVLVRRIDSDFVNGTNLLLALGIPSVSTRTKHLMALPSHVPVPALSPSGVPLQKGIPGIWIPLSAAREMARRLQPPEKQEPPGVGWLTSLLRDDLSDMFNDIAQVKRRNKTMLSNARRVPDFGCQFGAGKVPLAHPPIQPSPSPTPSLFSQSSAHSRSAPNLNTLATSALPPAVSALAAKAPLIRSAPPTPPKEDANAHVAKRRRALTMSSDSVTVCVKPLTSSTTSSVTATATRRSARASVGGGAGGR